MLNEYESPLAKYSLHAVAGADSMGMLETLGHGTVATVVDAGTTLFNSLVPERMEASTEDLLSRIDANALQVYNEHPDAIQFASFFVGSAAPVGLALKGMSLLRAGSKGVNWFSKAGRESRLAEVKAAYEGGVGNTIRLNEAQNMVYKAAAANILIDNLAAEVAIIGAMNSHPYMEDYYKDLKTNFAINMALGGTIGGIASHIIARGAIRDVKIGVQKETTALLNVSTQTVDEAEHSGVQLATHMQNAKQLKDILEVADSPESKLNLTTFTKTAFTNKIRAEEANAVRAFQETASEDIKKLDTATQTSIQELLTDPRFMGYDKLSFLKVADSIPHVTEGKVSTGLKHTWNLFTNKISKKTGKEKIVANEGVYSPVFDRFFSSKEAHKYSTLADLGTTVETLEKNVDLRVGFNIRVDAAIEHSILPTARVEEDFAKALLHMEKKSYEDLLGHTLAISPDDLASMKAVYIRLGELAREGHDIKAIKIVLTKEAPNYAAAETFRLRKAGFSPSYLKDMEELNNKRADYQVYNGRTRQAADISENLRDYLQSWISGSYTDLRHAAAKLANPQISIDAREDALSALKEFMNHKKSRAFRDYMSANLADADSYVLLYRGLKESPKTHRAIESYTLNPGKAGAFTSRNTTGLRLYKVHIDDILGTVEDFATTNDPLHSNMEIMVAKGLSVRTNAVAGSEDAAKFFSTESEFLSEGAPVISSSIATDFSQLSESLVTSNLLRIKEYQSMGMGFEEIALRTGVPVETVVDIISNNMSHIDPSALLKYTSRFDIEELASVKNRALVLGTNLNKVPSAEFRASLNASTFKNLGQAAVEFHVKSSPDDFVRHIGDTMLDDEARLQLSVMEKEIDSVVGAGVRSSLTTSANFTVDKLGAVGEFITAFGKKIINLKNEAKVRLTTALSQSLAPIAKSDAILIEYSNALNIQAAATGPRIYKARQFWQYEGGNTSLKELIDMDDEAFLAYATSANKEGVANMKAIRGKGDTEFRVATTEADEALKHQMQIAGRALYHLKNAAYKATGKGDLHDLGFWAPANNPRGKQIAYSFDRLTGETTMLMAKTDTELNSFIERFTKSLGDRAKNVEIITKAQQADFNTIAGRHDPMYMAVADAGKQHGGASALAELTTTPDLLAEVIQGYDHYINQGIDNLVRVQLHPIMSRLDDISRMHNNSYSSATLSTVQVGATKGQDPGNVLKNILLGRPNLSEHPGWGAIQSGLEMISERSLKLISDIVPFGKGKARTLEDWIKVQAEMEAKGIVHPFQVFIKGEEKAVPDVNRLKQAFLEQQVRSTSSLTPRAVALSNSLAATVVLRFLGQAQALTNMLSIPILMSGAVNKKLAASYAGQALDPSAKFTMHEIMYEGVALMNSQHGVKWHELANKASLFKDDWRVVNGIFKDIRNLEPGPMSKTEDLLDSKVVEWLSYPADKSETLSRQVAFFAGVSMAKRAYPTLGDAGVVTFARRFMDEAIGNYAAAQRPAMFQGTVGMAMGLFQTYMLTMAQSIYRQVETRNWAALSKMMLTQQTIFGTSSLPGFHPVSELIGSHFSDDNYDITSGTFRAFDNKTAEIIMYGLPSQLVGITTRGDIQPRLPLSEGISSAVPALNILTQSFSTMDRLVGAAFQADKNAGVAMLEALSLQSISRPIARMAEMASGRSITSKGNTVVTNTNPLDFTDAGVTFNENAPILGTLSRTFGARPIEEIRLREADHLDTLYGSMDKAKRSKLTNELKSRVANGNLGQDDVERLAYEYLRTGSPTGWRSAVNEAIAQSKVPGSATVRKHLSKDSAAMTMIDDLD